MRRIHDISGVVPFVKVDVSHKYVLLIYAPPRSSISFGIGLSFNSILSGLIRVLLERYPTNLCLSKWYLSASFGFPYGKVKIPRVDRVNGLVGLTGSSMEREILSVESSMLIT